MRSLLPPVAVVLGLSLGACAPPRDERAAEPAGAAAFAAVEAPSLRARLASRMPGLPIEAVRETPVPGVYEIQSGVDFAYVSEDGRYLLTGSLIDLDTQDDVTEARRQQARLALLEDIGPDETIDFLPAEAPQYTVTVFTDIDCGYCRMLHRQIKAYNERGIGVRYAFFPRSGPDTESFFKAEQVWCSDDRRAALTQAKQGEPLAASKDCANPVAEQHALGEAMRIGGTPAIILPDGEVIPGYFSPDDLLQRLRQMPKIAG